MSAEDFTMSDENSRTRYDTFGIRPDLFDGLRGNMISQDGVDKKIEPVKSAVDQALEDSASARDSASQAGVEAAEIAQKTQDAFALAQVQINRLNEEINAAQDMAIAANAASINIVDNNSICVQVLESDQRESISRNLHISASMLEDGSPGMWVTNLHEDRSVLFWAKTRQGWKQFILPDSRGSNTEILYTPERSSIVFSQLSRMEQKTKTLTNDGIARHVGWGEFIRFTVPEDSTYSVSINLNWSDISLHSSYGARIMHNSLAVATDGPRAIKAWNEGLKKVDRPHIIRRTFYAKKGDVITLEGHIRFEEGENTWYSSAYESYMVVKYLSASEQ